MVNLIYSVNSKKPHYYLKGDYMKKNKGFTLVELVAAMGIMVVLLNSFTFMMAGSAAVIKQDKVKVRVVSFSQYFMQTLKSYGKQYYENAGITTTKSCGGYFYFNTKDDLDSIIGSKTIGSDNFKNDIKYIINGTGANSGKVFKGTYADMITKSKPTNIYGAYFEISASNDMGKNEETGASGDVQLDSTLGLQNIRVYIRVSGLRSSDKSDSDLTYYIGR